MACRPPRRSLRPPLGDRQTAGRQCVGSSAIRELTAMKAPFVLQIERLTLRKPESSDADAIFTRYASDPEVTRYMSWPTHRSVADTEAFLSWSDADWERWPAGSYLVFRRDDNRLLGGTGLTFQTPTIAITGYVFARDAWGCGYATESLLAMVELARATGVKQVKSCCHVDHRRSAHVLEKCGFQLEEEPRGELEFPNLTPPGRFPTFLYVRTF